MRGHGLQPLVQPELHALDNGRYRKVRIGLARFAVGENRGDGVVLRGAFFETLDAPRDRLVHRPRYLPRPVRCLADAGEREEGGAREPGDLRVGTKVYDCRLDFKSHRVGYSIVDARSLSRLDQRVHRGEEHPFAHVAIERRAQRASERVRGLGGGPTRAVLGERVVRRQDRKTGVRLQRFIPVPVP